MDHENVLDEGHCCVHVVIYGYATKEGEDELWAERKDFVKDNTEEVIDKYMHYKTNYPPYSDLLISRTKQQPKKVVPPQAHVSKIRPCRHGDYYY